jgi:hypothetical protein
MRRGAIRFLALLASAAAGAALGCEPPNLGPGAVRIETPRQVLLYRADPAAIPLNARFALEIALCARDGSTPELRRVDAWMPSHRHGMNYRPELATVGPGRWRADGLLFHMPGAWAFVFEAGGERLSAASDVE